MRGLRSALLVLAVAAAALLAGGCGEQGIQVPASDETHAGAVLFAERCSGCHTLKPAGTQGSSTRSQRQQGPNFDQRKESFDDALFAIQNGGFSGAIMPANIAVGEDAIAIARFLEKWSGQDVSESPRPGQSAGGP